jgi:hypothetical protein
VQIVQTATPRPAGRSVKQAPERVSLIVFGPQAGFPEIERFRRLEAARDLRRR